MTEQFELTRVEGIGIGDPVDGTACPDVYQVLIKWRLKGSGRSFTNDLFTAGVFSVTLQWLDSDTRARTDLDDACQRVGIGIAAR